MSTIPSPATVSDKLVRVLSQSLALELAFLEMCDDEELHPDVAVKRMENIANDWASCLGRRLTCSLGTLALWRRNRGVIRSRRSW
jgi:hypothetical protein